MRKQRSRWKCRGSPRPCRSCKRDGLSSSIMRCRLRHASQPSYLGLLNSETLKCTSSRSRSLDQCLPSPPSPPKSKLQVRKAPVSNPAALKHKSIAVVSSSPSSSWRSFCSSSSSSALVTINIRPTQNSALYLLLMRWLHRNYGEAPGP